MAYPIDNLMYIVQCTVSHGQYLVQIFIS